MALYVTRPRRDEERIGRGLPSGLEERQEIRGRQSSLLFDPLYSHRLIKDIGRNCELQHLKTVNSCTFYAIVFGIRRA